MPVMMPGGRNLVVVHAVGGERRQLEERRAGIDQRGDALARQQLAAREVALARGLAAALRDFARHVRAGRRPAARIAAALAREFGANGDRCRSAGRSCCRIPSWPGLTRPSFDWQFWPDRDGRVKPGHDGVTRSGRWLPSGCLAEQLAADQHAADFAGAGADLVELGVAQQAAGRVVVDVAVAAEAWIASSAIHVAFSAA